MNKRQLRYTCAVIVVHGKTEEKFAKYLSLALRVNIHIIKDTTSIQVNGLINKMNSKFKTLEDLKKMCMLDVHKKEIKNSFRIFTIMDLDDCEESEKNSYKNKRMFDNYKFKDYIVPIYNDGNIEEVFYDAKIYDTIPHDSEKLNAFDKAFPSKNGRPEIINVEELNKKLKNSNKTNMDIMLEYLLEDAKKYSYK